MWARDFPKDAQRGDVSAFAYPEITFGKKIFRLVPATRIHNQQNLLIQPVSFPPKPKVMYQLDFSGNLKQLWILSEDEVKALGPAPKQ